MPQSLIHRLTGPPGALADSSVACGSREAALGSFDPTQVTCPQCQRPGAPRRTRGGPSEKALLATVTAALTHAGYLTYHTHDSRHSPAGFPDVIALKGSRCLVAELKSATGLLTPAQQTWLAAWRRILGAEVMVVRPDDLETLLAALR